MLSQQKYVTLSLEQHLFFARLMKEHAIFMEAGLTDVNEDFKIAADTFKEYFEGVLSNVVGISNGFIRPNVLASNELITDYTLGSERKTEAFTGIKINNSITISEAKLYTPSRANLTPELYDYVVNLNSYVKRLLDNYIKFIEDLYNAQVSCNIFISYYPLLIEHLIDETREYRNHVEQIDRGEDLDNINVIRKEIFWDEIMMQHALFIRGMLDPTENDLILTANDFANEFNDLLNAARRANEFTIAAVTDNTLSSTLKLRDFKESATKGIASCKIRSIILPLLADHVLREANHYIRLLQMSKEMF